MNDTPRVDSIGRPIRTKVSAREAGNAARAIEAAQQAIRDNITIPDVAKQFGVKARAVNAATRIVLSGTEKEIQDIKDGKVFLDHVYQAVLARVPPELRTRKTRVLGPEVLQGRKLDSVIYRQLQTALDSISNLPQPADVIAVAKKNKRREESIDHSLMTAFAWITEFSDAWTK